MKSFRRQDGGEPPAGGTGSGGRNQEADFCG